MQTTGLTAVFHRHGPPLEVLQLEEQPIRQPAPDEVLVRLRGSSINPADLNVLEGVYAKLPPLPATPGMEGFGEVAAVGENICDFQPGDLVYLPLGEGHWREYWTGSAENFLRVPPGLSLEMAASLRVNPATAWRMLHDFFDLQPGEWILQNAANSAVGRCVIQIARQLGWKTVNFVRRPELIPELLALGADAVLPDHAENKDVVAEATGGAAIRLALNTVGGESASRLISALAAGGSLVTYGAMSRQPVRVSNGALIFKNIAARGFWVTRWYDTVSLPEKQALLDQLASLCRVGLLAPQIDRIFPLAELPSAIARALESGRNGKVLLKMDDR